MKMGLSIHMRSITFPHSFNLSAGFLTGNRCTRAAPSPQRKIHEQWEFMAFSLLIVCLSATVVKDVSQILAGKSLAFWGSMPIRLILLRVR